MLFGKRISVLTAKKQNYADDENLWILRDLYEFVGRFRKKIQNCVLWESKKILFLYEKRTMYKLVAINELGEYPTLQRCHEEEVLVEENLVEKHRQRI